VIIDEALCHGFLPDLIFHQDEPIADPVCVPLYYVSKLARESGTTVVQVGEGADENFQRLQKLRQTSKNIREILEACREGASVDAACGKRGRNARA